MKAINEKGTIKTYSTLKSYGPVIGLQYASDEKLKEIGFHDVVTPTTKASEELGQIKWDSENGVFTYPVVNKTYTATLAEMKENAVKSLKSQANTKLAETDWYIVRKADTGAEIPQNIIDTRASIRSTVETKEAEINALTTKAKIVEYDLSL
tara:strand:+ start:645 stop:1100 length:456 start_codon:yes stop_codon:yes gene_type:complete